MKFPVTVRHRREKATIYGKSASYAFYRLGYYVSRQRRVRSFKTYAEAKTEAERIVRELAEGSQAAALSGEQSRDALAAMQRLEEYRKATGRRISLLAAMSEYVDGCTRLKERTWPEAIEGYLAHVVSVKRKDIAEAVEEFLKAQTPLTKGANGQRAQLSGKYAYNRQIQLRKFAGAFPGTAVCDLSKAHLDAFLGSLSGLSAKSRNHYRAAVRQWLQWAVRKDFLAVTHRLGEADGLHPEHGNTAEVAIYSPGELAALLQSADETMRPLLAIGGLAGLRTAELLRLDWADVWRVPGHIEITAQKSKTRQRRLVEICQALASWLETYRSHKVGKLWTFHEITFQEYFRDLCSLAKVTRKPNGLRHGFCSYHFALHSNENLTAAQAGNSPDMIHGHYKGLATKAEAEKWFNVELPQAPRNVIAMSAEKIA
jgi:integrase